MTKPRLVAVQAGPVWIAYHYSDGKATVVKVDLKEEWSYARPSLSTTPNTN